MFHVLFMYSIEGNNLGIVRVPDDDGCSKLSQLRTIMSGYINSLNCVILSPMLNDKLIPRGRPLHYMYANRNEHT